VSWLSTLAVASRFALSSAMEWARYCLRARLKRKGGWRENSEDAYYDELAMNEELFVDKKLRV